MRLALPGALLVAVMAQPNLAAGMMPLYRSRWTLDPLAVTLIFSAYLFALVSALSSVGRPTTRTGWWWRIAAGGACGVVADVVMAASTSPWVACAARIASGLMVGLTTGPLAGLILERLRERGRTAIATGSVLGSAVGVLAAAVSAQYLPSPMVTVYVVHALVLAAGTLGVFLDRGSSDAHGLRGDATATRPTRGPCDGNPAMVGYLSGISAWVSAGLVAALLPSYGAQLLATSNLAALALPVALYLLAAWAAQRLVPAGRLPVEPVFAQSLVIAGVVVMAAVPLQPNLVVLMVGGIVAGCGQGLAYRAGLRIVSTASEPARHAQVTARFAMVTYLCAAIGTVGLGLVATATGMSTAVAVASVVLFAFAVASGVIRIRGTAQGSWKLDRSMRFANSDIAVVRD